MSDIFISYARPNETEARRIADALRGRGWAVWRDDELPPHRAYAEVIEERLRSAKAVVVVWTVDAAKSQWVRAEADIGRERGTLVQLTLDGSIPPLPFNQIQSADLSGWSGEEGHPVWRKIIASISDLIGEARPGAPPTPPEPPALSTERPVVTVRSFAMMSGTDADGVAAGLAEEVRNALARNASSAISVGTGRKSAAARALDDDYILEGAVQQAGDRLRVSTRLTASGGAHVWSERFDGSRADVFELQDRVAQAVAANVEASIRSFEGELAASAPEDALNTRQLFYRGLKFLRQYDREGLTESLRLLERVLERNASHLNALGLAAVACGMLRAAGFYEEGEEAVLLRKGVEYAQRELQLSDVDPYATGLAATGLVFLGRPTEPLIPLLDRILTLAPSFALAWVWSGYARVTAGDLETSIAHLRRAHELDPRSPSRCVALWYLGAALMLLERYEEAHAALTESIQIRAHNSTPRIELAICLARMGRIDEARAALNAAEAVAPVARARFSFRNSDHRRRMREGLALAGFDRPELVFIDP
jgi:TolB-like protein